MRKLISLCFTLYAFSACAQNIQDGVLTAKILPLDTAISAAHYFNGELLKCNPTFAFQFVDRQTPRTELYLFKSPKDAIIRIEYKYAMAGESDDTLKRAHPRTSIVFQKITADNETMASIYNCIFGDSIKAEQMPVMSSYGSPFAYKGADYIYTLGPDDYKPGYWVLTFTK